MYNGTSGLGEYSNHFSVLIIILLTTNIHLKENIMGKGQDAKKNVKKEPAKNRKRKKSRKEAKEI